MHTVHIRLVPACRSRYRRGENGNPRVSPMCWDQESLMATLRFQAHQDVLYNILSCHLSVLSAHPRSQCMQGITCSLRRCWLCRASATPPQRCSWIQTTCLKKRRSESVKSYSTNGNGSNIDTRVAGSDLLLLWLNALAGQAIRVSLEPGFPGWLAPLRLPPGHLLQFLYGPRVNAFES